MNVTMPISPRWSKVIRDLWTNKVRTILVMMAIAVGVFAFGSMFITRKVLLQSMNEGFASTNPATITVSMSSFDESLVRTVRTFPNVKEVSARASASVQVWNGKSWSIMQLDAVPDFENMTVSRVNLEQGSLDPQRRQVLLERQSILRLTKDPEGPATPNDQFLSSLGGAQVPVEIGDKVLIELPDNSQRELEIVGTVHDFNAVPAGIVPVITGYVSLDTLTLLDLSDNYSTLAIVTDPAITEQAELETVAENTVDLLERYGYTVYSSEVTPPGKHWASDLITALVLILVVLGFLALGLSGFLVINTITAILTQQKRQIGMMKAVGARTGDVIGIYLLMAGTFGVLALLVALPVGILMSWGMSIILANFLNADTYTSVFKFAKEVPLWVLGLQTVTAVITPLVVAMIPVLKGTRTTVREAVSDYGITGAERTGLVDRILAGVRGLSRPVMLSLRNTFRRKGRLIITLLTLSIAGAIFIAVLNSRLSILKEFSSVLNMFGYDVQVALSSPQPVNRLQREAMRVDHVESVEGWGFAQGTIMRPDGLSLEDLMVDGEVSSGGGGHPGSGRRGARAAQASGSGEAPTEEGLSLMIFAPPPDTAFIKPTMLEGRWLQSGDTNKIVIGSEVLKSEPYIKVGDDIRLDFGDYTRTFEVVGIVNLVGPEFGYAPFDYITRLQGAAGQSFVAMIGSDSDDNSVNETIARDVEERFQEIGIGVSQSVTSSFFIGTITSMVDFFVYFMLFMAVLLGAVGGLGLASTMSLNVLERTREIGVMRAIGAANVAMMLIFLAEGILIGLFSFVISIFLSFPITYGFVVGVGNAFFQRPMSFTIWPPGYVIWFFVQLAIATLASLAPAMRAARVSVREALAYE